MNARYARLAEIAKTMHTAAEQAAALGCTVTALKFVRIRARKVATTWVSPRELPRQDSTFPGRPACAAHGDHECVSAERAASFRSAEYADLRVRT